MPTSLIEVEITESLLVKDSARVRDALERLRELGCRIALDDFGTGYSSLAYITRFPPDRIKIDKAFVQNLDRSASDAAIANAILSLGESLNVTDHGGRHRASGTARMAAKARLSRGPRISPVAAARGARAGATLSRRRSIRERGARNPAQTSGTPLRDAHHGRAGDLVVPRLPASIEGDPEESEPRHGQR